MGEPLTLAGLDEALCGLASEKGRARPSGGPRGLRALLERTDDAGRRFLFELLTGEVRQGALDGLVLGGDREGGRAARRPRCGRRRCSPGASASWRGPRSRRVRPASARFSLRLLSPVAPMLASPAGDAEEALERLGEAAFEYKLDGARLQVHRAGDEVRVFTRQLQDVTARVPEVVEWARALPVREAVVEGEALALRADGRPRPFQETMRRLGRKLDVEARRAARSRSRPSSSTASTSRARARSSRGRTPSGSSACSGSSRRRRCCRASSRGTPTKPSASSTRPWPPATRA